MLRFCSPFVLDLRAIALFRICFGSLLIFDILQRLPFVRLFLSDDGAFSRADLLITVDRPWSWSVYLLFGETSQVTALLLFNLLAALALTLGLRTRIASVVCWALLVSLQHRNPLVLNGGDTLLGAFAFWAMFLPLNARWSLDRILSKTADPFASNQYHGMPGAAILLQVVMLYCFTVLLKSGELWRSGDAVGYVLRNVSLVTEGGIWLRQYDWLHPILTRMTYHWEWIGCVLILFPFANGVTRLIAVFGYALMQFCFFLTLDIGLFPFVSILGCVVLLPSGFLDTVSRWSGTRLNGLFERLGGFARGLEIQGGKVWKPGRLAIWTTAIACALTLFWNLRGLPDSPLQKRTPELVENVMRATKLRQKWGMFAANPPRRSSWYVIEAQFANGDTVDLFEPNYLFSLRRPDRFAARVPDRRWSKFLSNLKKSRYRRVRDEFLEYFVSRWNNRVGLENKIERASLMYLREPVSLEYGYGDLEVRELETIYVKGIQQMDTQDPAEEAEESEEDTDV